MFLKPQILQKSVAFPKTAKIPPKQASLASNEEAANLFSLLQPRLCFGWCRCRKISNKLKLMQELWRWWGLSSSWHRCPRSRLSPTDVNLNMQTWTWTWTSPFFNEISFCTKPWEDDIYSSAHKETALWGPLNGMEKAGTRFPQLDETTNVKKKSPNRQKQKKNKVLN